MALLCDHLQYSLRLAYLGYGEPLWWHYAPQDRTRPQTWSSL